MRVHNSVFIHLSYNGHLESVLKATKAPLMMARVVWRNMLEN